ncbi:testis-expressed protein 13B isoform X1 [Rousettus aegyptiacus]|uniref:testis-expressed protein 13B isoform X1 n=1 Tax=Rousettus aegyptiacus TaxID=9407 RepID=UPI00168CF7E9|nr:testis-expressed protein 13B isoform X1 [Rousettus aegyptiacus]
MALKPEDPSGGFQHSKVVDFINEKMARHVKGLEFYVENTSLSWVEVEDKLRAILEDSAMPSKAKEACAWGSLALGVRFARRQGQLNACRVQWLHEFAKLHKSAARTLASDLKALTAQQEMERKEAAYQLQLTQAKLAKVQKERDLLRCKLLHTELQSPQVREQITEGADLATANGTGTERAGEEEYQVGVLQQEEEVEEAETKKELGVYLLQLLRGGGEAVGENTLLAGRGRETSLRSVETAMFYFSGTLKPGSTTSPATFPIQLIVFHVLIHLIPLPRCTHTITTSRSVQTWSSTSGISPQGAL